MAARHVQAEQRGSPPAPIKRRHRLTTPRAMVGPRSRLFHLHRESEQRRLVVGAADELHGERRPVAEKPAGMEAAGCPVEFQRTVNGTQLVSQRYVAVAPQPSIIPAVTAGCDMTGVSSASWSA